MSKKIRVFLADDHVVVLKGLEVVISAEDDMEVIGTAVNGVEAIDGVRQLAPDVVLLDLHMPQKNGLDVIEELGNAGIRSRFLILTSFGDDHSVLAAIKGGALGYLFKDTSSEELVEAIRQVHAGKPALDPNVALKVIHEFNRPEPLTPSGEPLTEREMEVLKLVAQGLSNRDIAEELVVSERTVRTHVSHILSKLHLSNRTQATLYALREGLSDLENE